MTALSKIGSTLGNPIYAAECTTGAGRISYARLLVEMDVTKPLPKQVKLQDPKGKEMMQEVEYDWEPKYCSKCLKIGHECIESKKPMQQQRNLQQKKITKGRMVWFRAEKEEGNEEKEKDQIKVSSEQQRTEPEQRREGTQSREAGWVTVAGKSAARPSIAKQQAVQSIDENNTFESLMYEQRSDAAGPSQTSSQGDQGGINKTYKQKEVKEFVGINNKAVIAIVEHIVKDIKAEDIIRKIAPGWESISNARTGKKERIWVMWDPRIYIFDPKEIDDQLIHGQISMKSKPVKFSFTAVYGLHTIKDREPLWAKLRQINSMQQGSWLAMGDFNAILHVNDRQHGTEVQDMEVKDFKEYMMDIGMSELQYMGREYTWTNNHVYSRIDRGLVNIDWMMNMPALKIQVLEPLISDHSPLKLMITQVNRKKSSPFRFFNCIAEHPQFLQ
ncbi:PREDICTED: uncharacterized protein LOC109230012 [Nicotiana attenuata]|uniref:uncharacterized protein LOC109230012 n=1 Tax=Nicotiana attenuata TaxID=49451 RepID=UPI000904A1EC|nr:PREDICTED: uncharacterized protein LOC109230012 [Nicotiana attenuata]